MFTALLLIFSSSLASAAMSNRAEDYPLCRYYFETDMMGCFHDTKGAHFWFKDSKAASPAQRIKKFKKEATDKCWEIQKDNKQPTSILFTPFCLGD